MKYLVLLALIYVGWILLRKRRSPAEAVDARSPSSDPPARQSSAEAEGEAERPFGEDITNPDARVIPVPLHGRWGIPASTSEDFLVLEPERILTPSGNERVIAVRFIREEPDLDTKHNVAVVSRGADEQYALRYFGLSADGALVDLESMDVVRRRID